MKTRTSGCFARIFGTASTRYWLPFDGISRVTVPTAIVPGAMPSAARAAAISSALRGRGELVERRAEIDHLGPLRRHQPRAHRELRRSTPTPRSPGRCAARAADPRPSGTTACRRGWRARAGSTECPSATRTAARTSSRRSRACARRRPASRAAPSAAPDTSPGSNLCRAMIGDVDAELLERVFGQILPAQADQRDVEARLVEARNHPREQALHAVHARPLPAEVIADVDDVQTDGVRDPGSGLAHSRPSLRYQSAVRWMPSSRSTFGAKPSSVRARVVSKARLLV